MDNHSIARIFGEIADVLEIKGENPFRIRAYRNAADSIATLGDNLEALAAEGPERLAKIPGIGKDLAAKIVEIVRTGDARLHRDLLREFPPTVLELLHIQGVGPKTVALLYQQLGVRSAADLERAAREGKLRDLRGMGKKKEELILKGLEERQRHGGRFLMPEAADTATSIIEHLREAGKSLDLTPVGSLRRGCETVGDIDILATGGDARLMTHFTKFSLVERVLGQGETKASVLLASGLQADLRLVQPESRGAALQYFTGSKAHNIAVRDRALRKGLTLNEYGLFRLDGNRRVAGETEEEIYEALDLAPVPPELRENRGEIELAAERRLPRLVSDSDILGDLHVHTIETDGRDDIEAMAGAARAFGLKYIAITDHTQALAMARGLDETRALAHMAAIRSVAQRMTGIRLLAGIECDIRADGTLDLADEVLAQLDLVIVSIHSLFDQDERTMTDRVVRAIAHPRVDIFAHPTGRLILRREPYRVNMETVIGAAAEYGVALEINCSPDRLDLNEVHCRMAKERGAKIAIGTDSHSRGGFSNLRWGVTVARRGWIEPPDVLNALPCDACLRALRRNRGTHA